MESCLGMEMAIVLKFELVLSWLQLWFDLNLNWNWIQFKFELKVNWIWFEFQVESNLNRNWMRFGSKRFHLKLKWNPTYLLCGVDLHLMCLWILGKLSIDGALCSGGQIMLFTYPLWEFVGKHFWFKDQDSFGVQTQKHQEGGKNKEKKNI